MAIIDSIERIAIISESITKIYSESGYLNRILQNTGKYLKSQTLMESLPQVP